MAKNHYIQVALQQDIKDIEGLKVAANAQKYLNIATGKVASSQLFITDYSLSLYQLVHFAELCLKDDITNKIFIDKLASAKDYQSYIVVAKQPGVTDDEGVSAQKVLSDYLNKEIDVNTQHIYSQKIYYIEEKLSRAQLQQIAEQFLGNKLINHFTYGHGELSIKDIFVPKVKLKTDTSVETINLKLSDRQLVKLSNKMMLALNLEEMKAIQAYYNRNEVRSVRISKGLTYKPTDCELEILAQTWSEHCKHKEFNAVINYVNHETGERKIITSLFKTYIKGATDEVRKKLEKQKNNWLVKVFTDNAGVVKVNDDINFVFKVETHNSPSALDPYGGAITGILGNNRDPLGTGIGGATLLFNTNVLCFGPPNYSKPLLTGQLHPRRIFEGVRHGIEDGGNKSGVPTVNGSIIFDNRYSGKPLVYCGTGALMKNNYNGLNSWEKNIDANDLIIMAGGRVGKDGIHGATFSSVEIDEHSPQSAVQIGSPITQKLMSDFLIRACEAGLVKCSTDNGAGGLSSSVGEMATISNGAVVLLDKVPLKYKGLKPWEIFVSESQERMTLVVEPDKLDSIMQMAKDMEVELSNIGHFTSDGFLDVRYKNKQVALLEMDFLHDGVPIKQLQAEWTKPNLSEPTLSPNLDYNDMLLELLGSYNICSRESVIRQYDHEVKGKTILKPLMGKTGKAPQDAAVMRVGFDTYEGIAVSNGIIPHYGDIDAYEMSAGAFDEAVRQIISAGGSLPNTDENDGIFWSINDNFCVPDSVYHPKNNPDGKEKLAKLVQMCEALYDMATYFDIPLTSGKDSMKNDFKADGEKISVPPTILYSMAAKIKDVRKTVSSNFKAAGDYIYQLGATYNELGCSQFYKLFHKLGANVPKVRKQDAKRLYLMVMAANSRNFIESSHDLSDGGLAVALAESAFGDDTLGVTVNLDAFDDNLSLNAILFSESHSRFVVSVAPENKAFFERFMGSLANYLGRVNNSGQFTATYQGEEVVNIAVKSLRKAWDEGLAKV